jgi:tyrosine-protein kinase Etk/Wzc
MLFRWKSKVASEPASEPAFEPVPIFGNGEPDMRALGRILWQKKDKIVAITLIVAVAAFVVVNLITPQYRSEARLLLEARENVFLRAEADKNAASTTIDPEAVASQIQVVLSRDLARKVIKEEKLDSNPEFDPSLNRFSTLRIVLGLFGVGRDLSSMSREERTLESYYEHLNVSAVEKSRVIAIDFRSANPELASRVANAIAKTYLHMQQAAKQDQTRAAGDWLSGEIASLRKKVADAEAKVEQYRNKSNLFVGTNNTSLPNQQLSEVNSQIAAARGQKADLAARARQLRELIRSGKPIESSDIANTESIRRLVEMRNTLRSQLAEQSTTLLDKHPRIKELKAQIAEVEREIRNEGVRLANQLDNDAKVAGDRIETLTDSLNQVKRLASNSNEQDVQLRALVREAKTERELLESYLAKYREASARDNINAAPPEARIISSASPSIKPAYPKKLPTVLVAAFAAFVLSCGFIVTGALLGPTSVAYGYAPPAAAPSYEPPAQQDTLAPQAAPVPEDTPVAANSESPPVAPAAEPIPEAMDTPPPPRDIVQLALEMRDAGDAGRRVALIGSMRNVGTTSAAVTLARVLAEEAKVVLVDLAFESPNLSALSNEPEAPGVAELIRGGASFGDIITRDQHSSVHLVATGHVGNSESQLAESPMLGALIEVLARSYDHLVIDAGSVLDASVGSFAALAPHAVLVAIDSASPATRAARERLTAAGFTDVTLIGGRTRAVAA